MLKALPYRPGVVKDDTELASQGYAIDSEQIRWVRGRAEALGGWVTLSSAIKGAARATAELTLDDDTPVLVIGTSAALMVWDGATLYDITPLRSSGTAGSDPIETTDGSSLVEVTISSHNAEIGATVYLRGATAVGGVTVGGLSGTLSSNPFLTAANSKRILVSHTAHGLATNDMAFFASATDTGGVPAASLNDAAGFRVRVLSANQYEIEVDSAATSASSGGGTPTYEYAKPYEVLDITANTITIDVGSDATSSATGGGAGVNYEFDINPGETSTTSSGGGYGNGLYGDGFYGQSPTGSISRTQLPARLWSLAVWGVELVANVVGGSIYRWQGNRSKRAATLTNAPAECNGVMVTPERFLLALGCTDGGGDFDPLLIRFADGQNITTWTPSATNNAGSIRLGQGSAIVAGRVGQSGSLVWTDTAFYRIRFVGEFDQIYADDILGLECGLLAPNAAAQTGSGAMYWLSSNYQFFIFEGGQPTEVQCPLRKWLEDRVNKAQFLKITASNDARYPAVTWDYQSGTTGDVDSYVRLDIKEQASDQNAGWSIGTRARSAWAMGSSFSARLPFGISPDGVLYQHESVYGDDGAAIARHVRWAPAQIDDGELTTTLTRLIIDGTYVEPFTVTMYGRLYPGQAEFFKGPMTLNGKGYIDRAMKARQIGVKIGNSSASFWRFGVIRGDISSGSKR